MLEESFQIKVTNQAASIRDIPLKQGYGRSTCLVGTLVVIGLTLPPHIGQINDKYLLVRFLKKNYHQMQVDLGKRSLVSLTDFSH